METPGDTFVCEESRTITYGEYLAFLMQIKDVKPAAIQARVNIGRSYIEDIIKGEELRPPVAEIHEKIKTALELDEGEARLLDQARQSASINVPQKDFKLLTGNNKERSPSVTSAVAGSKTEAQSDNKPSRLVSDVPPDFVDGNRRALALAICEIFKQKTSGFDQIAIGRASVISQGLDLPDLKEWRAIKEACKQNEREKLDALYQSAAEEWVWLFCKLTKKYRIKKTMSGMQLGGLIGQNFSFVSDLELKPFCYNAAKHSGIIDSLVKAFGISGDHEIEYRNAFLVKFRPGFKEEFKRLPRPVDLHAQEGLRKRVRKSTPDSGSGKKKPGASLIEEEKSRSGIKASASHPEVIGTILTKPVVESPVNIPIDEAVTKVLNLLLRSWHDARERRVASSNGFVARENEVWGSGCNLASIAEYCSTYSAGEQELRTLSALLSLCGYVKIELDIGEFPQKKKEELIKSLLESMILAF